MKEKLKEAYMACARTFGELSSSKRTKVGSVVVKDDRILAIGYNGTPKGWDNSCEDLFGVTKEEVIHAEANCIAKLARSNDSSVGAVMFTTLSPCIDCAKQIHTAGITKVYYSEEYRLNGGLKFLEKVGVEIEKYEDNYDKREKESGERLCSSPTCKYVAER